MFYGIKSVKLSDSGQHYIEKYVILLCNLLYLETAMKTSYHMRTNVRIKCYNRLLLLGIRLYVAEM